ncbi:glycosyltransferase [Flavobacterium selenitireducens]|uniref:glycosyltransferase n=1 Tax=Flavobacterium selenitireducens TaxID=2722704 RepID=UPI00168AF0CE|nr:glycosyltransferase [Flavobacterium selenitireducens]MBD3582615.1 hypothetical protein [Flavobacterium selenitireducens]
MFRHYLITRFNLRKKGWDVTKNNEALLTDAWMDDRLRLFGDYCVPSVAAQTNRDFTWLLFFDSTTPERFRSVAEALVSDMGNARIFYIDGMDAFYPEIKKFVTADANSSKYLITSRMDNDDCIHRDYIQSIQNEFKSQDYRAIDIIKGYSLQVEPQFMLGKKEHAFNPFISLIEKNDDPKTVWFNDHNLWKRETRITQLGNKRLWMSIIHGKNKVNEFDGYDDVSWQKVSQDFVLSAEVREKITRELLPHRKWRFTSFRNRLYVKLVLASKLIKKSLGIYRLK